jgi:hypothetical protein
MDERAWQKCADPLPMIRWLGRGFGSRRARLWAAACWRGLVNAVPDEGERDIGRRVVRRIEPRADGRAGGSDLALQVAAISQVNTEDVRYILSVLASRDPTGRHTLNRRCL